MHRSFSEAYCFSHGRNLLWAFCNTNIKALTAVIKSCVVLFHPWHGIMSLFKVTGIWLQDFFMSWTPSLGQFRITDKVLPLSALWIQISILGLNSSVFTNNVDRRMKCQLVSCHKIKGCHCNRIRLSFLFLLNFSLARLY